MLYKCPRSASCQADVDSKVETIIKLGVGIGQNTISYNISTHKQPRAKTGQGQAEKDQTASEFIRGAAVESRFYSKIRILLSKSNILEIGEGNNNISEPDKP